MRDMRDIRDIRDIRDRCWKTAPQQHQGVALVSVLLMLSITTVMAIAIISKQQILIFKQQDQLDLDKGWHYVLGTEDWAIDTLQTSMDDGEGEGRNPPLSLALTLDSNVTITAKITDLQGRFNINTLVDKGKPDAQQLTRFRRLLHLMDLETDLVDSVIDWIDDNEDLHYPAGAEDDDYLQSTPAYRAGNQMMSDKDELIWVKGITNQASRRLSQHLVALPEQTPVNVNSATAQVLMSLADGLSITDAESIIQHREKTPFEDIKLFLKQDALAGIVMSPKGLSVDSHYYLLEGEIQIGEVVLRFASTIHLQDKELARVIRRKRKSPFDT